MHTVIEAACTGCDLCLPVCPVDCIEMVPISDERTGWSAWSPALAQQARQRYEARQLRLIEEDKQHASRQQSKAEMKLADLATHTRFDADKEMARKRAIIEAALAKAKARQKS
jgi:Na+-translocating ferredoxin:NAD+ oxidoreductase subunit B